MSASVCPGCGSEQGLTHGDQLFVKKLCDECLDPVKCPACGVVSKIIEVALHLSREHHWVYRNIYEWMESR